MLSAVQLVVMVMLTVNCYGSVSADDLSRYFADKVEQIRSTTSSSTPPTFTPAPAGLSFTEFTPLSSDDVAAAVSRLPDNNNNNKFISSRQVQSVKQSEYKQRVLIIAINAGHL